MVITSDSCQASVTSRREWGRIIGWKGKVRGHHALRERIKSTRRKDELKITG